MGGPSDASKPSDAASDVATTDTTPFCDLSKDPASSAPCVDDAFGVFVDGTNGNDGNPGSKMSPVATIGKALSLVGGKPRVYICAGAYVENVTLTSTVAPNLYGGFVCGTWAPTAGAAAVQVTPSTSAALTITSVTTPITIADIAFVATDGTAAASPSSIGAIVSQSTNVVLKRVSISAGAGFTQAPAAPLVTNYAGHPDGADARATGIAKGAGGTTTCTCVDGTSNVGGAGGGLSAGMQSPPSTGLPKIVATNAGMNLVDCFSAGMNVGGGGDGSNGPALGADAPPTHAGVVDQTKGWLATDGKPGAFGKIAQGGGGGGDNTGGNGYGSGGGCGGCGGHGGFAGLGGGASIALVVIESGVALTATTLTALAGGAGGDGGQGEQGESGTDPGTPVLGGCSGGGGGDGSGANGGGGGSGGSSFGVLFYNGITNRAVSINGTNAVTTASSAGITVGTAGTPGIAGPKGAAHLLGPAGNDGPAGFPGVSSAIQNALQL